LELDKNTSWLIYPDVRRTAAILQPTYKNALYWNPRTGAWMSITAASESAPLPPKLPPCVPRMKEELAQLDALQRDGTLLEDEWRKRRAEVIENCLGSMH